MRTACWPLAALLPQVSGEIVEVSDLPDDAGPGDPVETTDTTLGGTDPAVPCNNGNGKGNGKGNCKKKKWRVQRVHAHKVTPMGGKKAQQTETIQGERRGAAAETGRGRERGRGWGESLPPACFPASLAPNQATTALCRR